jgi:hypothetical protein
VYDYDRLCPTDDLLGTAEVFFSEEAIETDPATGGEKVSCAATDVRVTFACLLCMLVSSMTGGIGVAINVAKRLCRTRTP